MNKNLDKARQPQTPSQSQDPPSPKLPYKKASYQFKALFLKNLTIQLRQPLTNLCQIFTPIICIIFTVLIRYIVMTNVPSNVDGLIMKYPMIPFPVNNHVFDPFIKGFVKRDPLQWFHYGVEEGNDVKRIQKFLGMSDGIKVPTGMLQNLPGRLPYKCNFNSSHQQPFKIQKVYAPVFRRIATDETINQVMYKNFVYMNSIQQNIISQTRALDHLSDGAVLFSQANNKTLKARLTINDLRNLRYHRSNGLSLIRFRSSEDQVYMPFFTITQGMISLMDMLSTAYIKILTDIEISSGLMYMPVQSTYGVIIDMVINSIATVLFPLSLSLLMPVFLYTIVLEKEQKLIQMMKMNGMGMGYYWLNNFLFNFLLSLLTNVIFCGFGYMFLNNAFFNGTSWVVVAVVLLGWTLAQIGMATFFQVFLGSATAANIIGYLISIWTNIIGATLSLAIYMYPSQLPYYLSLYPTFAFNRIFYLLFSECSANHCIQSFQSMSPQLRRCIVVLYVGFFVFSVIGMYLHEVVPQEFGVRQPLLFPLNKLKEIVFQRKKYRNVWQKLGQLENDLISQGNEKVIDTESMEETNKIRKIDNYGNYPLICSKLRKIYSNGKVAVNQLDLVIQDNEIFGLLGPNGAGKTTLISMITGVFSPTKGNAYVDGASILTQIGKVHLAMGVCPQFDILWPQLTVQEHLYFYARLKGIQGSDQDQMVNVALKQVNLINFRKFLSKNLSGGMKRRLSVGISLVGDPRIVFLDQPTTGLDPQNRRQLWQVLSKLKTKRSLFLTTHSMEQADTLCNRVGIITNGHLRTIGTQLKLKRMYGSGYHLSINLQNSRQEPYQYLQLQQTIQQCNLNADIGKITKPQSITSNPELNRNGMINQSIAQNVGQSRIAKMKRLKAEKVGRVKQTIEEMFPEARIDREISGFLRYGLGEVSVSEILNRISKVDCEQIRQGWAISHSTLEDVFMKVVIKYSNQPSQNHQQSDHNHISSKSRNGRQRKLSEQQHLKTSINDEIQGDSYNQDYL